MKDGLWTVAGWNNKDAILIHEDGTFEVMSKCELPACFGGRVYVGESVVVETIVTHVIRPQIASDDERQRSIWAKDTPQERERFAEIRRQMAREETPVHIIHKARP